MIHVFKSYTENYIGILERIHVEINDDDELTIIDLIFNFS